MDLIEMKKHFDRSGLADEVGDATEPVPFYTINLMQGDRCQWSATSVRSESYKHALQRIAVRALSTVNDPTICVVKMETHYIVDYNPEATLACVISEADMNRFLKSPFNTTPRLFATNHLFVDLIRTVDWDHASFDLQEIVEEMEIVKGDLRSVIRQTIVERRQEMKKEHEELENHLQNMYNAYGL